MKEQELIDLGFEKEEGDCFFYYSMDFTSGLSLITDASDEIEGDEFNVMVFDTHPTLVIESSEQLHQFINLVKSFKCKVKQKK